MRKLLLYIIPVLFLCGCSSWFNKSQFAPVTKGGGIEVVVKDVVTVSTPATQPTSKPFTTTITEKTTITKLQQPDNPEHKSTIKIDTKTGKIDVNLTDSEVPKAPKPIEPPTPVAVGLGKVVIIAGVIAALGGVLAFWNKWAGGFLVGGALLTLGYAAVMDKAAGPIGIIVAVGVGAAMILGMAFLYHWYKSKIVDADMNKKALDQTVAAIDETKKDPQTWSVLKQHLKATQDEDVKSHIKDI